jgi:putative nucleotidyltransferase with HDIG domain
MRQEPTRWTARPGLARALRSLVFLVPVAASVAAAWTVNRLLPPPAGHVEQLRNLLLVLAVSTAALWLLDRVTRRLLPLATLLELGLLFPQEAPSRLDVARGLLSSRPIEEQLERVRDSGTDPASGARTLLSLLGALSVHDQSTRRHVERVRMFTDLIAEQMQVAVRDRDLLRWAAILHDIGKLRVPAAILNKPGKPDAQELAVLHSHPEQGAEIAGELLPWLGEWGQVIAQHHENWDGTGYPKGLSGRQICLGARIVAVADAFDVMTAGRAYQRAVSRTAAFRELVRCSGSQFDPQVVRALLTISVPRLRRTQGVVAWLADVPFVAANTVPVANLARLIGVGALATGALTTGQQHQESLAPPPALAGQRPGVDSQQPPPAARPVSAPPAPVLANAAAPSPTRTSRAAVTPIPTPTTGPSSAPIPTVTALPIPLPTATSLASGPLSTATGAVSGPVSTVTPFADAVTGAHGGAPLENLLGG